MARTDRRGRGLRAFLIAEIVGDDVTVEQMLEALDILPSRYYGDKKSPARKDAADFPNANELRNVAANFNLGQSGWLNLLTEFGWLSRTENHPGFSTGGTVDTGPLVATAKERGKTRTRVDTDTPPV